MTFRSLFQRSRPVVIETPTVEEVANPQEIKENAMSRNEVPVTIPANITGTTSKVVNPSAVLEIRGGYGKQVLMMAGGTHLVLEPELPLRKTATRELLNLFFPGESGEQILKLQAVSGRMVNPACVQTIDHSSGPISFFMTDGQVIVGRPSSFESFRNAVRIVHGEEAAKALRPQAPPPEKTRVIERPERTKPPTMEEQRERLISENTAKRVKPAATVLPRVTTSDPQARFWGIESAVARIETEFVSQLWACPAFAYDGGLALLKDVEESVRRLRSLHVRLGHTSDPVALAALQDGVQSALGAVSRLPQSQDVAPVRKALAAELDRLSDLQVETNVAA